MYVKLIEPRKDSQQKELKIACKQSHHWNPLFTIGAKWSELLSLVNVSTSESMAYEK